MFEKLKRAFCGLIAAAVMAVVSVSAYADYTYDLGSELCDQVLSDWYEVNGTEGVYETEYGDSTETQYVSLRFMLFNEYLDAEYWNSDDVRVEVDVKLETEGADVIACLPGFNSKWDWVNPDDYTPLKYGEWITISEKASHYYDIFAKAEPAYILLQVRTNWGAPAQGKVKLSIRNMRIVDGTGSPAVVEPEPVVDANIPTVEPAATIDTEGTAQAVVDTVETKEQSAGTQEAAVTEPQQTTAATTSTTTAQTTIRTAATAATSAPIDYSSLYSEPESPVMMIVIIVGIAAFVSIAAVVGYLIYRKKKFY